MSENKEYKLDKLCDVLQLLKYNEHRFQKISLLGSEGTPIFHGDLYCPMCGDLRRMSARLVFGPIMLQAVRGLSSSVSAESFTPSIISYNCLQCDSKFTAIIYEGLDGSGLAVIPPCLGGLRTPHTPDGVAYYLDQAHRSQSLGANSAAMAMYRAALEHLLFEQGYIKGMLYAKIQDLEDAVKDGIAPKWAAELDTDFLMFIKQLGDGAIHPNDGDVTKQAEIDNEFLSQVQDLFRVLLHLIYEVPHEKKVRMDSFRTKSQILRK